MAIVAIRQVGRNSHTLIDVEYQCEIWSACIDAWIDPRKSEFAWMTGDGIPDEILVFQPVPPGPRLAERAILRPDSAALAFS